MVALVLIDFHHNMNPALYEVVYTVYDKYLIFCHIFYMEIVYEIDKVHSEYAALMVLLFGVCFGITKAWLFVWLVDMK